MKIEKWSSHGIHYTVLQITGRWILIQHQSANLFSKNGTTNGYNHKSPKFVTWQEWNKIDNTDSLMNNEQENDFHTPNVKTFEKDR